MDNDTLLFLNLHPAALELYDALERWLLSAFPAAQKRVQKTQISFLGKHVFACVSFARVRPAAALHEPFLCFTLGLPEPLDSPGSQFRPKCVPAVGRSISCFTIRRSWTKRCWTGPNRLTRFLTEAVFRNLPNGLTDRRHGYDDS